MIEKLSERAAFGGDLHRWSFVLCVRGGFGWLKVFVPGLGKMGGEGKGGEGGAGFYLMLATWLERKKCREVFENIGLPPYLG